LFSWSTGNRSTNNGGTGRDFHANWNNFGSQYWSSFINRGNNRWINWGRIDWRRRPNCGRHFNHRGQQQRTGGNFNGW
jgi:hypothetical protein